MRRGRERRLVVGRQTARDVARPHKRVARVVVQEPRRVDDPEQNGDADDRRRNAGRRPEPPGGRAIRGDDSGRVASVRPTASNVVRSPDAVLPPPARRGPRGAARQRRRARRTRVTPAGWAVRPGGRRDLGGEVDARASRARSAPRSRRRAASCCRSRARRRASTPPTCSTCARASRTGTVAVRLAQGHRRGGVLRRRLLAPAASARGRRAAARTSSTSTTSARRCKRDRADPDAVLPGRARLRPARRGATASTSPTTSPASPAPPTRPAARSR